MPDYSKLSDVEINRLVAERLGWTDYRADTFSVPTARPPTASGLHHAIPNFTTDPAAYMPLFEQMEDKNMMPRLLASINSRGVWRCDLLHGSCESVATSIGRVICETFLKWKATEGGK